MSIVVHLPDGSSRNLADGATALTLANDISPRLAAAAIVAIVDDRVVDLSAPLANGSRVQIVTDKDPVALETVRHSAAHLMAAAVLAEFPKAQLTIGPVTEDGFYYDLYFPPDAPAISEDDFPRIEARMAELAAAESPFSRCVAQSREDEIFKQYQLIDGGHNKFKDEMIKELEAKGAMTSAPDAPELSFYKMGDFVDLCRGPHVPHTGWLKHTKLMKVAGAYWRADASREHLVRLYGTAFLRKKDLDAYLHMLEEARKRDHRVLGEQLDLFHFEEDAPGLPFLHAKGTVVYNALQEFMRAQLRHRDYQEVRTPIILSEKLWHISGHYDNYMENMFFTKRKLRDVNDPSIIREDVVEERAMAVKPMNCPGHVVLFNNKLRSHNELPLRMAEMGLVHRREASGVRHGLFRVQAFVQDDAHHFCTTDQIESEVSMLIDFFFEVYSVFDLTDVQLELSTRPAKSIGSDEMWERAEAALEKALKSVGKSFKLNPGDGAFYGPKIDFHIRDSIGRTWQCGTIQCDFSMPARFSSQYVGADGDRHQPVMIHRACYGSLERFFGIITEHYAAAFPLWLAPVQVDLLPVSEKHVAYAKQLAAKLRAAGLRVHLDDSDDRLGYKIRKSSMTRVPYALVVGAKEEEHQTLNVRTRDRGELGEMTLAQFLDQLEPRNVEALMAQLEAKRAASAGAVA